MNTKKETKEQLYKRIANAPIHVNKTKSTKEVYFNDKLLRLTVDETEGYAIVGTLNHKHLFNRLTPNGISKPYLYISRFVDIAIENDCIVRDDKGNLTRSYAKLMESLKNKEEQTDFTIATYVDWYLYSIFTPLYSISEDAIGNISVYLHYIHSLSLNGVLRSPHKDGLTSKQLIKEYMELFDELSKGFNDYPVIEPIESEGAKKQIDKAEQELKNEELLKSVMED